MAIFRYMYISLHLLGECNSLIKEWEAAAASSAGKTLMLAGMKRCEIGLGLEDVKRF